MPASTLAILRWYRSSGGTRRPPPGRPASARRASSQVSGEFGATRRSAAVLRMIAGLTTRMLARNRRPDLSYVKGPAPAAAQPQVVEREEDLEHDQRHDHPLHAQRVLRVEQLDQRAHRAVGEGALLFQRVGPLAPPRLRLP